ncbi:MAG: MFS transporter [Spirochaetaceae bacterium]|nr:MFS transporter [Spirochaetaceae bacterium]
MDSPSGAAPGARFFPALGKRNFRLFWLGQCVSLVGTWMQNVGQSWLVLDLTGSPAKLGLVSAVQFLPMMLLSLFAGPFVDRFPKRRTLIVTQTALMLLALTLAVLAATGAARYWMILVLAFLLGMVNLVDMPTRQAYVIEIAGRENLVNAVSLNSAAFNLARIAGPAVAGLLMEAVGAAPCFFLNALSFVAVIAALLAIDAPPLAGGAGVGGPREVLESVRDGLRYIRGKREIYLPLSLMAVVSTFVINYNIFVPTFARGPLGRGASGFGFLMTAMGLGSLAAALILAARSGTQAARGQGARPSPARLYGGALGMCVAIALCGLQRSYALTAVLLGLTGFCTITFTASTNAGVQLASDDAHRGRVMSVYSLVFGGVTPVGALYAGAVTDAAGPAACMVLSGSIGFAAALGLGLAARGSRRRGPARPAA